MYSNSIWKSLNAYVCRYIHLYVYAVFIIDTHMQKIL